MARCTYATPHTHVHATHTWHATHTRTHARTHAHTHTHTHNTTHTHTHTYSTVKSDSTCTAKMIHPDKQFLINLIKKFILMGTTMRR